MVEWLEPISYSVENRRKDFEPRPGQSMTGKLKKFCRKRKGHLLILAEIFSVGLAKIFSVGL